MANFYVDVSPMENIVTLGATATFECNVIGNVQVQQYEWVGSGGIAKEERFSYGESKRMLYINDVKAEDNQTFVDCTVTAIDGRTGKDVGRIVVLPNKNVTMVGMRSDEIPPLTAGGGVVIAFGFILVIIAMIGALKWLKREEIQKVQDMETARNRYSRIEPGRTASSRAHYDRDQSNVRLGSYKDGEDANDDSYEDMLPVVPKTNVQGGPARDSPRGPPRGGPVSGQGRYGAPPRR